MSRMTGNEKRLLKLKCGSHNKGRKLNTKRDIPKSAAIVVCSF